MHATLPVEPLAALLRALSDETRLRIVALLAQGELCVCHIERSLALPQPTVSRQLAVLRHAGVVATRRRGTWIYYRLAVPADPGAARALDAVVDGFRSGAGANEVAALRSAGECP